LIDKETPIGRKRCPCINQTRLAPAFDGLIQVTVLPPRILDAVLKLVYVSSCLAIQSAYSVFVVKSFYFR